MNTTELTYAVFCLLAFDGLLVWVLISLHNQVTKLEDKNEIRRTKKISR